MFALRQRPAARREGLPPQYVAVRALPRRREHRAELIEAVQRAGHDVVRVRSGTDEQAVARAVTEPRVLLTADKDFGEPAFRSGLPADNGVVLLRLRGSCELRAATLLAALAARDDWAGHCTVVEPNRIRVTRLPRRSP